MLRNIHVTDLQLATGTALQDRDDTIILPRAYQLEMLEESLKRNVIVAVRYHQQTVLGLIPNKHQMDTGSGKTNMHVLPRSSRYDCLDSASDLVKELFYESRRSSSMVRQRRCFVYSPTSLAGC